MLYVYSVEIAPEHRGRGFGREAMLLFEDEARSRGIPATSLTVLGGNEIARSLYRSLGYTERAVFMSKIGLASRFRSAAVPIITRSEERWSRC